jgi:hypothetical protein
MTIGFLNLAILAGMAALVIPPIIHFLNRRRHDVVDWGAMQFLQVNPAKKRRMFIEELLLMALRMGLIALLVAAFAAPYVAGPLVAGWGQAPRDIALVLDASGSMRLQHAGSPTAWDEAQSWLKGWLGEISLQDRVVVVLAGQPPRPLNVEPTTDRAWLRRQLEDSANPVGAAEGPRAVHEAYKLLRALDSTNPREIIVLSDRQKFGWTDAAAMLQWRQLKETLDADRGLVAENPQLVVPTVAWRRFGEAQALKDAANYRLAPLEAPRTLVGVGQKLRFTTAMHGERLPRPLPKNAPPRSLRVLANGQSAPGVHDVPVPATAQLKNGQAPVFEQRFDVPGVHIIGVKLDIDAAEDALPGDNEQSLAVEVVQEAPILLVDGADDLTDRGATYFLAKAFADPGDKTKVSFIIPRRTTTKAFDAEAMLLRAPSPPQVSALADVPSLTPVQRDGVAAFVREGGGLLIVLGPRVDARHYNEHLWRNGDGWLPAKLDKIAETKTGQGATLDVPRFVHPALQLFRAEPHCTLGNAEYGRWWRVGAEPRSRAAVGAVFTNGDPWLVEQSFGKGRVILSTLPMDRSWEGHLPRTWEFPVLAHELVYSLAELSGGEFNLAPGQPLRVDPSRWRTAPSLLPTLPALCTLHGPGKLVRSKTASAWPLIWEEPGSVGTYRLDIENGPSLPFVVHSDPRESDLTPQTDEDFAPLRDWVRIDGLSEGGALSDAATELQTQEVWWLFLAGVIGLFCTELWLTRCMALARGRA